MSSASKICEIIWSSPYSYEPEEFSLERFDNWSYQYRSDGSLGGDCAVFAMAAADMASAAAVDWQILTCHIPVDGKEVYHALLYFPDERLCIDCNHRRPFALDEGDLIFNLLSKISAFNSVQHWRSFEGFA